MSLNSTRNVSPILPIGVAADAGAAVRPAATAMLAIRSTTQRCLLLFAQALIAASFPPFVCLA
jgi:hypothetical protein